MANKTAPLTGDTPQAIQRTLKTLNETVDGMLGARGDPMDRVVTRRELVELGLARVVGGKLVKL